MKLFFLLKSSYPLHPFAAFVLQTVIINFSMLSNKCFEKNYHMEIQRDSARDKNDGKLKTMEIHVLK